jgi:predicted nucleotidyltransferase
MRIRAEVEPFREAIEAIHRLLYKFDDRGVIIGGIAVGFLGKPRFTEDVDGLFLLSIQDLTQFLEAASKESITPRIPKAESFARKNRVLLLIHNPSGVNIDVFLGILPFEEEVVERGRLHSAGNLTIRLPTPEDLIILKAIAHRPKDLEDILTIIEKNPNLDTKRIKRWVQSFADVLEDAYIWEEIADFLN